MSEDFGKNLSEVMPEYMMISLISSKINVLVVGGGPAGFIKAKSFAGRGCKVFVVSKEFCSRFDQLSGFQNVKLIKEPYEKQHIHDKHLIVIATNDPSLNQRIQKECEESHKIYLTCDDFRQGLFVTPVQKKTDFLHIALHTVLGSPKTSGFLLKLMEKEFHPYQQFVSFLCTFRNTIKDERNKNEIMDFMNTEDFYEFYQAGKHLLILKMFYPQINIESGGDFGEH